MVYYSSKPDFNGLFQNRCSIRQNHGNMSHSNISLISVLQTNICILVRKQKYNELIAQFAKKRKRVNETAKIYTHTQINTKWEFYTSSNKCSPQMLFAEILCIYTCRIEYMCGCIYKNNETVRRLVIMKLQGSKKELAA